MKAWHLAALAIGALAIWGYKIMTRAEFKKRFYSEVKGLDVLNIPLEILAGLASYESGDGNGSIAGITNNIFSLTAGKSWVGPVYEASTGYRFRIYKSWRDSTTDFLMLMKGWPTKYGAALKAAQTGDMEKFAKALQAAGYGDPGKMTYAAELIARTNSIKGLNV